MRQRTESSERHAKAAAVSPKRSSLFSIFLHVPNSKVGSRLKNIMGEKDLKKIWKRTNSLHPQDSPFWDFLLLGPPYRQYQIRLYENKWVWALYE